jgi:hypothetical protein
LDLAFGKAFLLRPCSWNDGGQRGAPGRYRETFTGRVAGGDQLAFFARVPKA